jgi:hypothetical protein
MAANLTIANLNPIANSQQTVPETSKPKMTRLLQRIEVMLRKAFGDDEETIANSLRGL